MTTKNTPAFIIHHSADWDGIFCREIAIRAVPGATVIGWDYGDPIPQVPGDAEIWMLDISIVELMDHPGLVWIDHHKTAMDKWHHQINRGYRIDGVAACRLAWQFFNCINLPVDKQAFVDRTVDEPLAVRLAGEWDVWDKRDPMAELLQHGLRGLELTRDVWDYLLRNPSDMEMIGHILRGGDMIRRAQSALDAQHCAKSAFTTHWKGITWIALNSRGNSLTVASALKPEHQAICLFYWSADKWTVSLYQAPGHEHIDLSTIAKSFGGGGHKGACGFIASDHTINDLIYGRKVVPQ